jgi:hypothetical protein
MEAERSSVAKIGTPTVTVSLVLDLSFVKFFTGHSPGWRHVSDLMLKKQTFCIPRKEPQSTPMDHPVISTVLLIQTSPWIITISRYGNTPPNESSSVLKFDMSLQLFRKEAIFRRMKHYSRENERCQLRISELERRKNTCEAGLAAVEACWTQVRNVSHLLTSFIYAYFEANKRHTFFDQP